MFTNANPFAVPMPQMSSSMNSYGRSRVDCVLNAITATGFAARVGPVVPIVVPVVAIRPTVGSVCGVNVSYGCPRTAAASPVPDGATVCRYTPTEICWDVGTPAPAIAPSWSRRSRNPEVAEAPQYPRYPFTVVVAL